MMGLLKPESAYDRQQRKFREETLPRLKHDALAMIPGILAEQPSRLTDFEAALENDRLTYEFRCERWGDFLALFVKRGPEPDKSLLHSYYGYRANRIVASVSLANSRLIKLTEGAAPDMGAHCMLRCGTDSCESGEWTYKVTSEYVSRRNSFLARMTVVDPPANYGSHETQNMTMMQQSPPEQLCPAIDGCAQAAEDDQIRFEGAGVALYAPFGRGQEIYEAILQAIKAA